MTMQRRVVSCVMLIAAAPLLGAQQWLPSQAPVVAIVDVGRARLETATWGSGEPVILLPGTGYSSTSFRLVGPEIARRGYRAIAVNPRGVGGSSGPLDGLTYHDYAADVGALVDRIAGRGRRRAGRMSSGGRGAIASPARSPPTLRSGSPASCSSRRAAKCPPTRSSPRRPHGFVNRV